MRRLFAALSLLCGLLVPVMAQQFFTIPGLLNAPIQSAQLWGGGLNSHQNWIAGTGASAGFGVHFLAPDGGGIYLQKSSDLVWHQVMTDVSLAPAACDSATGFMNPGSCFGVYPVKGVGSALVYWAGAIDVCGSPADSTRAFVFWNGYIFRSDNVNPANPDALTWINTNQLGAGFTKTTDGANLANRIHGPFLACDPNNKDHLLVMSAGAAAVTPTVQETKDGGLNFTTVSSSDIPASVFTGNGIVYIPAFDSGSGTTGGVTNTVCVFTNGTPNGIYCSVTGGGTGSWGRIGTGGPTTVDHMEFNPFNHLLLVVDTPGNLWTCTVTSLASCTWVTAIPFTGITLSWVAVDPITTANVVAMDGGGNLYTNTTSGAGTLGSGWTGPFNYTIADGDAPWYVNTVTGFTAVYNIAFDPIHDGGLAGNLGQGHFTTPAIPSSSFVWTSKSKGVMHQAASALVPYSLFNFIVGSQDISTCTINLLSIPTQVCSPITLFSGLKYTSGLAVSPSDPTYAVAETSANFSAFWDGSGWSHDGFKSDYHVWNRWERTVVANVGICGSIGGSGSGGAACASASGNVRVTVNSTAGLTTWSNGQGTILCSYTTTRVNGSNVLYNGISTGLTSCYPVSIVNSTTFDLIGATYTSALTTIVSQIDASPGAYVFYDGTWPGSNLSESRNITSVAADSNGKIQVCMFQTAGGFALGMPIDISGVVDSGFPTPSAANGRWIINAPASGTLTGTRCFDLGPTSTPSGNAYVSGGTGRTFIEPGGSIATSGPYVAVMPGNNGVPRCSTDLGTSIAGWSDVTNAAVPGVLTTVTGGGTAGSSRLVVADGTKIAGGTVINVPMDDGRLMYAVTENNLTVSSGTYDTTTGNVVLTLSVETAGITGDQIIASKFTGTGAFATIGPTAGATYTTTSISGGGLTIAFTAASGLGATTITGGTFSVTGNAIPLARVTFAIPNTTHYTVPTGRSIANGANVYNIAKGWVTADFLNSHVVTADTVTPNTFYMVNWIYGGLIKWVGCGATIQVNPIVRTGSGGWQPQGGSNATLSAAPGEEGHLLYTDGTVGAPPTIASGHLQRTCNGVSNVAGDGVTTGVIFQPVKNAFSPLIIGFGKNAPGKSYPAIVYNGWYDPKGQNLEANAIYGNWRSTDDPNHGNTGASASCKDSSAQFTGTITGTTLTFPSVTGTVSIGDGILATTGGDVAVGTKIVSGSGLSWQVNISQNVGPEAMTAGGTFQLIFDYPSAFPGGPKWNSRASAIACDLFVYGPCVFQTTEGPFYGVFN